MKKIMMLGAGSFQLSAIHKIKELGFSVVVSDHRLDSPGKRIGDISVLADTFSFDATYEAAKENEVDGLMTSGTDQPVLTVNKVAEKLGLPQLISVDTALWVTNKKYMKMLFTQEGIPTVPYALCSKGFQEEKLAHLKPPYIVKPVDSQGQRGIYKLTTIDAIRSHMDKVLEYSREDELLVESYYPNDEITVTGWVCDGRVHVLTVTDRVTFASDAHIGVCTAHEYPSRQLPMYRDKIMLLTEKICKAFDIVNGPIYFQFLVGDQGIMVNEIACRIGGAYEDLFVPQVTGIDILSMNILSCVEPNSRRLQAFISQLESYAYSESGTRISVQLFFCNEGQAADMTPRSQLVQMPYILDMGYNISKGDYLKPIENASQRAGYALILGADEETLHQNIENFYTVMKVFDESGKNLVIKQRRIYRS